MLRVGLRRIPLTILDDSYRKTCALGALLKHSTCILWQTHYAHHSSAVTALHHR
jgi:hypothetical protein